MVPITSGHFVLSYRMFILKGVSLPLFSFNAGDGPQALLLLSMCCACAPAHSFPADLSVCSPVSSTAGEGMTSLWPQEFIKPLIPLLVSESLKQA